MPNTKVTKLKENDLHKLTPKYIEDEDLRDPPARLFRRLLKAKEINLSKWNCLLKEHLNWEITTDNKERAKSERTTALGNIKTTYFMTPTLSFNKLLTGLSILKDAECELVIRVKGNNGEIIEVSEVIKIHSSFEKTTLDINGEVIGVDISTTDVDGNVVTVSSD